MAWNKKVRQFHRWMVVAFTVTIVITSVGLALETSAEWVTYLPLLPLALLFFSGLNLFAQPYTAKWRAGRRATADK
jgi:hypothetical protein